MKRSLGTLLCLLAGASLFAEGLQAVKCTNPPEIDGKLNEACWKTALKFSDFKILNTTNKGFPATVYLLYGEDAVYVGARFTVPEGGKVKADAVPGKGSVYSDDCMEIMVDANATATRYFQLLVNANGAVSANMWDQGGFVHEPCTTTAEAAGQIGKGYWTVEVRIPFSDLDILPGKNTWGFNFAHDAKSPYQESSIAENGLFHNAPKFAQVENFRFNADRYMWDLSAPKIQVGSEKNKISTDVTVSVGNLASVEQKANFDLTMVGKDEQGNTVGIRGGSIARRLKGKERVNVSFPRLVFDKAGNFRCILSITDPVSRALLKRKVYQRRLDFTPFLLSVKRPAYRNMIFASQDLKEVVYTVKTVIPDSSLDGCTVTTGIRDANGKILAEKTLTQREAVVKFPAASLPEGNLKIFTRAVKDGKTVGESTVSLRKLPFQKGEIWRDEHGIWHAEKEPVFLIGAWGDSLPKGANAQVQRSFGARFCLERDIVYVKNFIALTRHPVLNDKELDYLRDVYRRMARIPGLFAHYIVDEPEISGCTVMALKQNNEIACEVDPYHPILCSNDTVGGLKNFYECAEINGLHPYPPPSRKKPRNQFERIIMFMDQAMSFVKDQEQKQTIAFLQQGFNYGDCGAANTCIPTFDEIRTQYLISLAMGGNGILFFNFCTDHYYELSIGNPEIASEFKVLTPAMTVPDVKDPGIGCDNKNIRFRVKKVGNEYWIIACSTTEEAQTGTITVPALGNRKLYAFREGRTLEVSNGAFKETFKNFDAHVYTTDSNTYGLRTLAEVEEDIRQKNESRRKPGNLAFQMYEHDALKLYASSNYFGSRTPDSALWHVTDGIMGGKASRSGNSDGKMTWKDKTPNQTPDWIVLEFPKPVKVGRIAVYPAEGTLKDYEVQVEKDGKFVTVGTATDLSMVWDKHQEFTFPQVTTTKVRLYVTANNGPTTKVHEIEVYEK